MINYTVGDKVLCLTDHCTNNDDTKQYIFKGNYYIVRGMQKCTCGLIAVDIGLSLASNEYTDCDCDKTFKNGTWWFHNTRFTKEYSDQKSESTETTVSKDETVGDFMGIFNKIGTKTK